ncbi:glycosyltransferase family 4 protein [Laccaria bicolor S238N-H82]|uniref:Glycosyltransferase family 4 protein n=1 Tax=Laccaria bicolor (strain S238N-H82 / ATCC MYA-4686) TaxID=486041 RepID=B0D5E6_LACBS|nr:glycosyltransferase family 4 protein [Laccaria bicolor S238N-H82]EDR10008.1 glycosyltransferase family 4 protein [Laccaria bicolor S238N-H82]|eukprot:XP_001879393.1 glycosyltransferase family 4 protein [Laccaria bicolor S238N-H82]
MRLPPSDQLLNALMANSWITLQLSTCGGFEVKVSDTRGKQLLLPGKEVTNSK